MLTALRYLADHPGASNREIAAAISVCDEGQMSRMMSRLSALDLARSGVPIPGQPHAWRLTPRGHDEAARAGGAGERT